MMKTSFVLRSNLFFLSLLLSFHVCESAVFSKENKVKEMHVKKANKGNTKESKNQEKEFIEETMQFDLPLDPQLDSVTAKEITTPTSISEKKPVTLWIGSVERMKDPLSFVAALSPHVGILVDAFAPLSADVLALISTQKRKWAMVMPTRSRFDGADRSPETLNNTMESRAYFEQILKQTENMSVFIPDMVDIDREVLEYIITLAKKHKLTLIIPPQVFNAIPALCQKEHVSYQLLDIFSPINAMFDDFKNLLEESLEILDAFGRLNIAIFIPDEHKKKYFDTYIHSIAEKKGFFVDVKTIKKPS